MSQLTLAPNMIACEVCGFVCNRSGMGNHRKTHDPNPELFPCTECDRVFRFKGCLIRHSIIHTPYDSNFFAYVRMTSECWIWTGPTTLPDGRGYGRFMYHRRRRVAHCIAYEHMVGPIPEGLELDHLCHNQLCVRPEHLEPVTRQENLRRATEHQAALGAPCPGCDFVATHPSGLASHIRHKHPHIYRPRERMVNGRRTRNASVSGNTEEA